MITIVQKGKPRPREWESLGHGHTGSVNPGFNDYSLPTGMKDVQHEC